MVFGVGVDRSDGFDGVRAVRLQEGGHGGGAAGGGGTGEEEADEVGQDFECDDPPGVADVDAGALGLLGVVEDALDLVLVDFYFHGGWGLGGCEWGILGGSERE